jgi:hypothetical protein
MLLVDGVRFRQWKASSEDEYESLVVANAEAVFGEDSHYFAVKPKLKSFGGVGSIPDGLVVFFSKPYRWAIVEVELSSHPVFEHILAQLNKFMVGYKGPEGKRAIVRLLDDEIDADPMLGAWVDNKLDGGELYRFLSNLVDQQPDVYVVVDEKRPDIEEACERIPEVKRIIEFKVFEREDAKLRNAFLFDSPQVGKDEEKYPQKLGGITQKEYTIPLLESLIELGGSAKTSMVLDRIYAKMESRFKPVDLEMLPSGTDIRWKNKVAWERQNLVSRGLLKKGSPSGMWEISEEGKRYLIESKS